MFGKITRELNGIRLELRAFVVAVRAATDVLETSLEGGTDNERLATLEGRIEQVAGLVEAGITKAEALKATARAAEDRARGHQKRGDAAVELARSIEGSEDEDPFEAAGRAFAGVVSEGDGDAGEGVPPVSNGLESYGTRGDTARAAKRQAR